MDKGQTSRPDTCRGHSIDSLYAYFERWLLSIEELNRERFAANKEAVAKAEEAQKTYNAQHNDLTRKMEAQAAQFVNRERLDDMVKQFDAQVESLKASIVQLQAGAVAGGARREVVQEQRQQTQWSIGTTVAVVAVLVAVITPIAVALIEWLRHSIRP